ncbi:hypothetical protein AB1I68_09945 [Paenibacillus pabuli]|uniref:hypothetical protein n=2 Tax=Paenibacillus TaxID=44249 RepID=UPI003459F4A7
MIKMGSRLMHLLISDLVCKELSIKQRGDMLLGAIAPDANSEKGDTHFLGAQFKYGVNRRWEYGRFITKYKELITEPFMLGYLTHLVADEVWAMKSYFSGFEERLKKEPTLYDRYHYDFRLCNAKLNEMFISEGLYEALNSAVYIPIMDELDEKNVFVLKKQALEDFNYPVEHIRQEMSVFSLDEILAYMERSAYRALDVCRSLLGTIHT